MSKQVNIGPLNLIMITTSIRTAYIWVYGYERTGGVAYHRSVGEIVYAIQRVPA